MSKKRRNHTPDFKAKVALAGAKFFTLPTWFHIELKINSLTRTIMFNFR